MGEVERYRSHRRQVFVYLVWPGNVKYKEHGHHLGIWIHILIICFFGHNSTCVSASVTQSLEKKEYTEIFYSF